MYLDPHLRLRVEREHHTGDSEVPHSKPGCVSSTEPPSAPPMESAKKPEVPNCPAAVAAFAAAEVA